MYTNIATDWLARKSNDIDILSAVWWIEHLTRSIRTTLPKHQTDANFIEFFLCYICYTFLYTHTAQSTTVLSEADSWFAVPQIGLLLHIKGKPFPL